MRLQVDSGGYVDACSEFYDTNHGIVDLVGTLSGGLSGSGGMAGTDTGGEEFAAQYDQASGPLLTAGCQLGEAMASMANLLNASLVNHDGADHAARVASSPAASASTGDDDPNHYGETISVSDPPSAKGGTGDQPGWWHWIASHVEGLLWPDADTGKLRSAGSAWTKAGSDLGNWTYAVQAASGAISQQTSPEVADVTATCTQLCSHITDLSAAYTKIGEACNEYADQVDAKHKEVEDELKSFLEWTAVIEGGGAVLAFFTAGISEAAAQAAEGAEVANAATKVIRILNDLIELARLGKAKILEAVAKLGEIGAKLTKLISAKVLRALERVGIRAAKVDLDSVPAWAKAEGKAIPKDGPEGALYRDGVDPYGGLSEQEFFNKYWDPEKGDWKYPTAEDGYPDGFDGPSMPNHMQTGDVIDRIGAVTDERGFYASPANASYGERAIPPSSIGGEYTQFRVVKELPPEVTQGKIAPWFEQPGGGLQYNFDKPMLWYVKHGYLEVVK